MKVSYSHTKEVFGSGWPKFGVEDEVKEGETPEQAMERLYNFIEGSHKKFFPEPAVVATRKIIKGDKLTDEENERQFNEVKAKIIEAETKEDAAVILNSSIWKKIPELKQLVGMKPSEKSKNKGVTMP
jgi:hypothetical protein